MSPRRPSAILIGLVGALGACGANGANQADVFGVTTPEGFRVELVADGFEGPTQFVVVPGGDLIVAELNGVERAGTGRVVRVSSDDPSEREVLVAGLVKPTGVTVDGNLLWIMEQRRLTVGPLDDPGDRVVVLDDLPFNGRSQGTLTALDGGGILYDTSGSRDAAEPGELKSGSGTLWLLESPQSAPEVYATGFKHAYAHVIDPDGDLWSTEMSDGRLDGVVPPDELVRVERGDDFGYPRCVGDGVPVAEFGADDDTCRRTPPSQALFPPGATPTGLAVAPWEPDLLLVALWNRGVVVDVSRSDDGRPHEPSPFLTDLGAPQHLVADGDRVLLGDFSTGRIMAISRL